MMSTVKITQVTGNDFIGTPPSSITIFGTATTDCTFIHVEVYDPVNGALIFSNNTIPRNQAIPVDYDPQTPALDNLWSVDFNLASNIPVKCGSIIGVRVSTNLPNVTSQADLPVLCKGLNDPGNNNPGNNNPGNGNNGGGGNNPRPVCLIASRVAAIALVFALLLLARSVALNTTALVQTALGIIAGAMVVIALWRLICRPSLCKVRALFCWVFMLATIGSAAVAVLNFSYTCAMLTAGYGAVVSVIIHILHRNGCQVPSPSRFPA
jgi:hypothetical protein